MKFKFLLLTTIALLFANQFVWAQSDNCSTATTITPGASCVYTNGSSSGATQSIPGCTGTADDDVWYKFVAGATSYQITVDPSAGYDPVVELFSGACASLTSLYCMDQGATDVNEIINATGLTSGQTYYVRVFDYWTGSGSDAFQICISAPPAAPANNNCAGATTLSVNAACVNTAGTSLNATQSQAGCVGTANDDVWYKFVATNTYANITVDPSAQMDAVVEVFSGACAGLTQLYCADVGYTDGNELVNAVGLTIGQTYFVRVYDYWTGGGNAFDICVTGQAASGTPNNDALCSAFIWPTVTSDCNYIQFTTTGGTTSTAAYIPTPTGCGGTAPGQGGFTAGTGTRDIWFSIVVPSNGALSIADNPNFVGLTDGVFVLYSTANAASCTANLTQIACNDDGGVGAHPLLNVTGLTPGSTVILRYFGYGTSSGNVQICVSSPTNDNCANALYICDLNGYSASTSAAYTEDRPGTGAGQMYGNNETSAGVLGPVNTNTGGPFGTNLNGTNGSAAGPANYDVTIDNNSWITFTASATTAVLNITVADCWYNNGMQMQIFSGTNCNNFVAVSNFKESANGSFTLTATGLTIGNNYYLVVDGFAGDVCNYTITANSGVAFPGIVASKTSLCYGDSLTLTGPAGATSYEWLPGGETTQSIIAYPGTNITYYCIAGGTCGYKQTLSKAITVNPLPTPSITGSTTVCASSSGNTYSVTAVAGSTYAWTVTGGSITAGAGTNSITVTWGTGASGTVAITQTKTSTTCSGADSKSITINPLPTPAVTPSTAVCASSTGNVYSVPAVAGHTYAWTITGGSITAGAATNSCTVTWGTGASGTITCTETITATTCSAQSSQTITLNPLPTPTITPTTNVCVGTTNNYSVTSVAGHTYAWTITNGTINSGAATNTVNVTWGTGASGSLTCTETITATTCPKTVSQTINFNALPTPNIVGNAIVCASSTGNAYSVTSVGGNTYAWTITGGSITAGAATNAATVTWGAGPTGQLIVTQTTGSGCVNKDTIDVTINPLPTPAVTPSTAVCAGTIGVVYSTPSVAGHTYAWTITGGSITAGAGTNSVTVTWGNGASGTITCTETITATTCNAQSSQTITINPLPTPTITPTANTCPNSTGNYAVTNVGGHSYSWTITGGVINSGAATNSVNVTWGAGSSGTLTCVETNGATTCSQTVSQTINLNGLPTPNISGSASVCANSTGNAYNVSSVAGNSYAWTITGGSITAGAATNAATVSWGAGPTGQLIITQTTGSGCSNKDTLDVIINPLPTPNVTPSIAVCAGATGVSYSTPSVGGHSYVWLVTGGSIASGQFSNAITVDWGGSGIGTVTVTELITATGCSATDLTPITIQPNDDPSFTYTSSTYCQTAANPNATITGGATGTFTASPAGLVFINTSTGLINLSASALNTYTITFTTNGTCPSTGSITLTITSSPSASFTYSAANYCEDGSPNPTPTFGAGASAGTFSATPAGLSFVSTNTGEIDLANSAPGVYNITNSIAAGASGCAPTSASATVTIDAAPNPTIVGNASVCANSNNISYSVSGTGNTYTWTVTGGTIASGQGSNSIAVNWGASGPGLVSLTEVNAANCTTSVNQAIVINALPNPNISGPSPLYSICSGATGITYNTANTGNNYAWAVTGGTITSSTTGNSVDIDWGTGATGLISVTETNPATTCATTDTLNITITPLDNATFNYSSGVYCQSGADPTPTSTVSGSYTATPAGLVFVNNATGEIDLSASLVGTYTITFTTNAVCPNSSSQSITISNAPSAAFTYSAYDFCQNAANPQPVFAGSFAGTFSATPPGLIFVNASTGVIDIAASTAGTYVVTKDIVAGASGCAATSDTSYITINAMPNPVITGSASVCENTVANAYSIVASGNTIVWTVSGGTITSGQGSNSITVDWATNGAGSVSVSETSAAGCNTTVNTNITINPTPNPSITGNTGSVCENSTGTYTTTNSGNTFNWTVTGGVITAGQGTNTITVTWGASGAGQVSINEGNASCSTNVDSAIVINSLPTTSISGANSLCQNATGVIYSTLNNAGNTYLWTVTNGTLVTGQGTNSITVDWPTAGTGSVSVTETTLAGCTATSTINNISVNALPTPNIIGASAICQNVLNNTYTTSGSGDIYTWTVSGGTITTGQGTNSINVNWNATGNQTITLVDSVASTSCVGTITIPVTVNSVPTFNASASVVSDAVCGLLNGGVTGITVSGGTPAYTYTWANAQGTVVNTSTTTPDINTLAAGSYNLTITDANGCISDSLAPFSIASFNNLLAAFSADTTRGFASKEITFTNHSQNADTYSWDFGDNSALSTELNPNYVYGAAGTYNVILTASNNLGCTDTAMVTIILETDFLVVIPNVFSPNEDGTNDIFKVMSYGCLKEVEAQIFNRWGEHLYDWTGVQGGWDGRTVSGTQSKDGVYYYLIKTVDIKGVEKSYQGTVTLVR